MLVEQGQLETCYTYLLINLQLKHCLHKLLQALRNVENNLPNIDNVEMTVLPNTVDTIMKEIEELFPERNETGTQTEWTKREIDGISKAMTTIKEELANNLAKLDETNNHLAREKKQIRRSQSEQ